MNKKEKAKQRLAVWQERFQNAMNAYSDELSRMDAREALYRGSADINPMYDGDEKKTTPLVRNIVSENIESCINTNIPAPKVTAVREEDVHLAKMIEDMLYCELDRLPTEELNDLDERLCPIHGSSFFLVEWDSLEGSHTEFGDVLLTQLGAKMVIPQNGVTSSVEDMEYFFLRVPQTKGYLKRRYGVDLTDSAEEYPEVRGQDYEPSEDMVTQIYVYYRNTKGGIGVMSWVHDVILEDNDDYQAHRRRICAKCGAPEPFVVLDTLDEQINTDGTKPECDTHRVGMNVCPYCESTKWEDAPSEYEEFYEPIEIAGEMLAPEISQMLDDLGSPMYDELGAPMVETKPIRVPYYKPDVFPLVQRKNVSMFGTFLGESDVDKMSTQQNVINCLGAKMLKKNLGGGTVLSLPDDADITVEDTEGGSLRIIRPRDAASAQLIRTYTLEGDISQDMALYREVYEEARQVVGVTDSLQGRKDSTATSAKAKQFSAAQSMGRFESKRVMKKAAWSKIYELIFKFKLAYAQEPRPVVAKDVNTDNIYTEFDRMAFLCKDDAGEYYWNDRFLFSCDDNAPLQSDRASMWNEASTNLARGAFGDPSSVDALLTYWTVLETFHYPSANIVKAQLEARKQSEIEAAQAAQQQMMAEQQMMQSVSIAQQERESDAVRDAQISAILNNKGNVPAAQSLPEHRDSGIYTPEERRSIQ